VYFLTNKSINLNFMERMKKMKKKNGLSQVVKIATVVLIIVLFLLVLRTRCIPQSVPNKFSNIVLGLDIF
jgi:uncharacterized membrane protein YvbJ